jgi:FG-GAP repeat protein
VTVGYAGGDVALLRGDGHGGFGKQETYATHVSFQSIAVGDFNGDGLGDLAIASGNTTTTDGKVIVVPARPPFPCLPAPGAGVGQCVQDAVNIGVDVPQGTRTTVVTWHTTHEFDVIGFNIIEYDPQGRAIRQNAVPIPCVECETGLEGDYAYPVARHRSGRNVFVEMLRHSGPPRVFGPASRK